MKTRWLAIKQIDQQLKEWQFLSKKYGTPKCGWIRTLRSALNMSAEQLGIRLGLTRGRINQLEKAEAKDSVTLRTLKETANAFGCEVVYAIVPKGNSTLADIIKIRAEEIAKERITNVAHTMSLEAQSVDADYLKIQQDELAENLAKDVNKELWEATKVSKKIMEKFNDAIKNLSDK